MKLYNNMLYSKKLINYINQKNNIHDNLNNLEYNILNNIFDSNINIQDEYSLIEEAETIQFRLKESIKHKLLQWGFNNFQQYFDFEIRMNRIWTIEPSNNKLLISVEDKIENLDPQVWFDHFIIDETKPIQINGDYTMLFSKEDKSFTIVSTNLKLDYSVAESTIYYKRYNT